MPSRKTGIIQDAERANAAIAVMRDLQMAARSRGEREYIGRRITSVRLERDALKRMAHGGQRYSQIQAARTAGRIADQVLEVLSLYIPT